MEITFVRHGESEGNAAGVWQGHTDSPLSARGRDQAGRLADRLAGRSYDLVVSSDLARAHQTAGALGVDVETDRAWRELHIGEWEGLTIAEVATRYPTELADLRAGKPIQLGGGESFPEFGERVRVAVDALIGRLGTDDRALVVAHGGVITAVLRIALGIGDEPRQPFGQIENTAITRLAVRPSGRLELGVFNDATHLAQLGGWARQHLEDGETVITLIRHGQTDGNVEQRWQGVTEGSLTADGSSQARALAHWYGGLDSVYASPLQRAMDTASPLAERLGVKVEELSGVIEMHMGEWEGRTTDEIRAGWADLWHSIYGRGEDLPRGHSGEAMADVVARMQAALGELVKRHAGARVGVVSHGGAIHAYVLDVLGLSHRDRMRLAMVGNTSVTHVVVGDGGARLADFNVAPHLE